GRDDTGYLKVGKNADIVALDLNKAHLIPYSDLISNLTYSAQGADVYMTMVNGNILYENGVFLTLDEERILEETKRVVKNLVE
ncbi:MAG: amidohydrolase family protein, partial [Sphaerochaetaceae bacterium]|nr:amidohydrolase family protein [Sphaerochaetaceae bacterium]